MIKYQLYSIISVLLDFYFQKDKFSIRCFYLTEFFDPYTTSRVYVVMLENFDTNRLPVYARLLVHTSGLKFFWKLSKQTARIRILVSLKVNMGHITWLLYTRFLISSLSASHPELNSLLPIPCRSHVGPLPAGVDDSNHWKSSNLYNNLFFASSCNFKSKRKHQIMLSTTWNRKHLQATGKLSRSI